MINPKNPVFLVTFLVVVLILVGVYFGIFKQKSNENILPSASPSASPEPTASATGSPVPSKSPKVSNVPLPTGDGRTTFINEQVPWELLLADASCELKGEIKFVSETTYDNQDALFIYKGVDHPSRNIRWTVTPADPNLEIGPNIFSRMPLPNNESLVSLFFKDKAKYKKYEIKAVMDYGRLVDDATGKFVAVGGNVRVLQKQCQGKTTVVLP